jgi:hypothetical protein
MFASGIDHVISVQGCARGTVGYLKIRSGTRNQPVKQSADRTFLIVMA